jgi:rhodanese-related sulfurtransferase
VQAAVNGSVNVPLFVLDDDRSFSGLLKQSAAFGTGGWWLGGGHMKSNTNFIGEVQAKIPKDKPVLVACQKGLRSLNACEQLVRAGYPTVAWLSGGYDAANRTDFDATPDKDMRYGGVAGLSGIIGWTRVQQREQVAMGGGVFNVLKYVRAHLSLTHAHTSLFCTRVLC